MRKRRRIKGWYDQRTARIDHECTKCDTPIMARCTYEREVFASGATLEAEKVHSKPGCASAYYTGN